MSSTRSHILETGRALTASRGYTAVGLAELLTAAGVPKGSFYHYFKSKEAFGCALLDSYIAAYAEDLASTLNAPDLPARTRLLSYFEHWRLRQTGDRPEQRCLVVKLSAEIADLSPDMRRILDDGVAAILARLTAVLRAGDGSIVAVRDPAALAQTLYQIWLGASLMASLSRDALPFDTAMAASERLLSGDPAFPAIDHGDNT